MDFIQIDKDHIIGTHSFIEPLKVDNKRFPLLGIGFGQQLLALFPAEPGGFEDGAQGVAADLVPQLGGNPVA
jgi:hypothetical protein